MRRNNYWPNMAHDAHRTLRNYDSCARKAAMMKHKSNLQPFLAIRALAHLAMAILVPLSMTPNKNQYVVFITNIYSNLTRAIPIARITNICVPSILLYDWIIP